MGVSISEVSAVAQKSRLPCDYKAMKRQTFRQLSVVWGDNWQLVPHFPRVWDQSFDIGEPGVRAIGLTPPAEDGVSWREPGGKKELTA